MRPAPRSGSSSWSWPSRSTRPSARWASAGIQALERTGLAKAAARVAPRARIAPVDGLLIASDRLSTDPTDDPPDYVSTYSPTARLCDLLTPRPRSKRALDVGTGNGIHALLAARHSRRVVATDVNPRALAFTELNAALSGLDNVECRRGSLFEPVDGERFDLIVCNAPYVVSPERRWTYRDGALEGDELSERVVRGAAAQLDEGGFANVCVTWLGGDRGGARRARRRVGRRLRVRRVDPAAGRVDSPRVRRAVELPLRRATVPSTTTRSSAGRRISSDWARPS